jgi:hypothetical protein
MPAAPAAIQEVLFHLPPLHFAAPVEARPRYTGSGIEVCGLVGIPTWGARIMESKHVLFYFLR